MLIFCDLTSPTAVAGGLALTGAIPGNISRVQLARAINSTLQYGTAFSSVYFRKLPYAVRYGIRNHGALISSLSAFLCRVIRALACCEQGPKIRAHRIIKTIACCPTKSTTTPEPDSRTIHLDLPKVRLQRRSLPLIHTCVFLSSNFEYATLAAAINAPFLELDLPPGRSHFRPIRKARVPPPTPFLLQLFLPIGTREGHCGFCG